MCVLLPLPVDSALSGGGYRSSGAAVPRPADPDHAFDPRNVTHAGGVAGKVGGFRVDEETGAYKERKVEVSHMLLHTRLHPQLHTHAHTRPIIFPVPLPPPCKYDSLEVSCITYVCVCLIMFFFVLPGVCVWTTQPCWLLACSEAIYNRPSANNHRDTHFSCCLSSSSCCC